MTGVHGYRLDNSTLVGLPLGDYEAAKERLLACKIDLVRAMPWLGQLVMTTEWEFTLGCPRMAATTIPNNKVLVNPVWLTTSDEISDDREVNFVIAHEILHIFLEHIIRAQDNNYHRELWNYATDYMINIYLFELQSKVLKMPKIALYEKKFSGMAADEIYHILLENAKGGAGNGEGEGEGNNAERAVSGLGGGFGAQGENGEGGENGKGQKPFDNVSDEDQTKISQQGNKQGLASAMVNDVGAKSRGTGHANLFKLFEDIIESVIPWREELSDFVIRAAKDYRSYQRPSRRSRNIIFPGYTGDKINIFWGTDSSGSMGHPDYLDARSELAGAVESFGAWSVALATCDTRAHFVDHWDSDEDDFLDIHFELHGGGGTDMAPLVRLAEEENEEYEFGVVVIVTDGHIPEATLEKACEDTDLPVLVLVTRRGNKKLKLQNAKVVHMINE